MFYGTLQRPRKTFLERVASNFRAALRYEDKELQSKALALIPLEDFEMAAESNMRKLQKAIKSGLTSKKEVDIQEFILIELLSWFKNSFFSWVDTPQCVLCKGTTKFVRHDSNSAAKGETYRTAVSLFLFFNCGPLGVDTVSSCIWIPMFWRNTLLPSSELMYEESACYMQVARKLITQTRWSTPVGIVSKKLAVLRAITFPSRWLISGPLQVEDEQ
jgi:hypothetical protein